MVHERDRVVVVVGVSKPSYELSGKDRYGTEYSERDTLSAPMNSEGRGIPLF